MGKQNAVYTRKGIPLYFNDQCNFYLKSRKEFPGCPMVKTQHRYCQGPGLIPGQGTKTPTTWCDQKKKNERKEIMTHDVNG